MSDQDSAGAFDPDRILAVLDTRGVEYVLVGGVAPGLTVRAEQQPTLIACRPPMR